jgi:PAS domain S-box-containing protein
VVDISPGASSKSISKLWAQVRIDRSVLHIGRHITKTGRIFPVEIRLNYLESSGQEYICGIARDISDRVLAETELRESRAFNETLLNSSPDIIYIYDIIEKKNVYSNEGIKKVLGYSVDELQDMGANFLANLMHPDELAIYLKEILPRYQKAKDDEWIEHDYRMKHKDGSWRWLRSKESIFQRQTDATPRQIFGVVHDITDRRLAEELLQDSERKLSSLVKHTGVGIGVIQGNKRVFYNKQMHEMLGYTEAEFKKVDVLDIVHPDDLPFAADRLQRRLTGTETNPGSADLRVVTKFGETLWIETDSVRTQWEGRPALQVFYLDITERKKAEQSLMESEIRYRTLFESANDAINFMDGDKFIKCNDASLQMFGCSDEDELLSKTPWDFSPKIQPNGQDSKQLGGMYIRNALEGQAQQFEWEHLRKDGSLFHAEVSLNKLSLDSKDFIQSIVRDVTERKEAESRIKERLEIETVLAEMASDFVRIEAEDFEATVQKWMARIGTVVGADRFVVWIEDSRGKIAIPLCIWTAPGVPAVLPRPVSEFAWFYSQILDRKIFVINDVSDIPEEATADIVEMKRLGIKSCMGTPLYFGERVCGVLVASSVRSARQWEDETANWMTIVAEIISNALLRRRSESELRSAMDEIASLKERLEAENLYLREEIQATQLHGGMIGKSKPMKSVMAQAEQVAKTDSTVLILGETGTGKELLARAIHELGDRNKHAMITVNCAAMPSTLVEGELFGREKGAYTGALTKQIGRFEAAHGGSIFLDEIGELPVDAQAKLLRVLESGQFERLGSNESVTVDVRVIAATNRDLEKEVSEGKFREDLFYRLNVFPITLPPLRDRSEDIEELVWSFVEEFGSKMGKRIESISKESMKLLTNHTWPGNVRELRNLVERSMILSKGRNLKISLPRDMTASHKKGQGLQDIEREHIIEVLEKTGWRIRGRGGAAEVLGMKPTTLDSRIKKHGITRIYKAQ